MNKHYGNLSAASKAIIVKIYALRVLKNHADFIRAMFDFYKQNRNDGLNTPSGGLNTTADLFVYHYAQQGYKIAIPINSDWLFVNGQNKCLFAKSIMQNGQIKGYDIISL